MQKIAFRMQLYEGQEAEYKRRHDKIWVELSELLRQTGIHDYSIFLDSSTNSLLGVLKIEDSVSLSKLSEHPIMQKWWEFMSDIMETNPDNSPVSIPLQEIFYQP